MNYQNISPQETYFYQGRWTEAAVNIFVNVLMDDAAVGNWNVDATNHHSIHEALDIVNCMMDSELNWNDVLSQRNMLEKRYKMLNEILEVEGAWYDRTLNHVYVPVWDKVFEVNDFAKAFYHKGDPMFDRLKSLFGKDHDRSTEVINISSDGPMWWGVKSVSQPFEIKDSDEEEVDSPVMVDRKLPRKKLFLVDEPYTTLEMVSVESNTANTPTAVAKCVGKKPLFPPICLKPLSGHAVVVVKNESSSCASCSPTKWALSPAGK